MNKQILLIFLSIFSYGMQKSVDSFFCLLPQDLIQEFCKFYIKPNASLEATVASFRKLDAASTLFATEQITKKMVSELTKNFPQETEGNDMYAAAILYTKGAQTYLEKYDQDLPQEKTWLNECNYVIETKIFSGHCNPKWVAALLENPQIADYWIKDKKCGDRWVRLVGTRGIGKTGKEVAGFRHKSKW